MTVILDVFALPRGERSRTRKIRDAFFAGYMEKHPDAQRVQLDLAKDFNQLPAFDEWDITAKFEMAYGEGNLDEEAAKRWDALTRLTDQLHSANTVVISAPMWNFSIPWMLKRWIDCVVQGKLTFEYVNGEFKGLLGGRNGVLITSRDGAYPAGSPYGAMDFQLPYMRQVCGFMGIQPVPEVTAEPMVMMGPQARDEALRVALEQAMALGRSL